MEEEGAQNSLFDKRMAQEEDWIRQGIKARRKRNEGRVRALMEMRNERSKRVKREGKAKIQIESGERSGRKVIEARNISYSYGDEKVIDGLNLKVMRGDRIGLIGNNGVGKSTLLKIILGMLEPQQGHVKLGTNLETAYFDQIQRDLDREKTVAENIGEGKEYINLNGKQRHIVGYLKNFLFSPKRALTPVSCLSGGECNRVVLAKLFTKPANLLVLDEPTNDLDVEMLEVLEERLVAYDGTLIIVSHDRNFLDNVVTSVLVFEEGDTIKEYVGGYSDWVKHGKQLAEKDDPNQGVTTHAVESKERDAVQKKQKLSYQLQRELDALPECLEKLEQEINYLQEQIAQPEFYEQSFDVTSEVMDTLASLQKELDQVMDRWAELEDG